MVGVHDRAAVPNGDHTSWVDPSPFLTAVTLPAFPVRSDHSNGNAAFIISMAILRV